MTYNRYSDDIQSIISITQDPFLVSDLHIPRSTAQSWVDKRKLTGKDNFVSLRAQVHKMENDILKLEMKINAIQATFEEYLPDMGKVFVPEAKSKKRILKAIDQPTEFMSLTEVLKRTRITRAKYFRRKGREKQCCLQDFSRCPKTFVQQITPEEITIMKDLFHYPSLSHFTTPALALYPQNTGKLFVSYDSWRKYSKKRGWKRRGESRYSEQLI